jgi:hypothetical protein
MGFAFSVRVRMAYAFPSPIQVMIGLTENVKGALQ